MAQPRSVLMLPGCEYASVQGTTGRSSGQRGLSRPALRRVLDYIHEHLGQDLTVDELAKLVYLSPYHFMRLFKATTGQTVHQYVITQRIEAGKRLLLESNLSIAQIAQQLGFTDQSHFAHYFKRLVGVAPSVLVKERRNNLKLPRNLLAAVGK